MTLLDAGTRLAGVLGHPVGHSLSPAIHNAAYRHEGRNACYLAFDVGPERFRDAVAGLEALGAAGCNVTAPHKAEAFGVAVTRSPEAERTRAVNTVVFAPEGPEGHNTDVAGVRGAVEGLEVEVAGLPVLVLGAGGAGRAAAWAVAGLGADPVLVANRTRERAAGLVEALTAAGHAAGLADWDEREDVAAEAVCLLNTTSVGLEGEASPLGSLERARAGACRAVLDLVYGPEETPLVHAARDAGIRAADGLEMLVRQAAEAHTLFWGRPAPLEAMRDAAARATGRSRTGRDDPGSVPPIA